MDPHTAVAWTVADQYQQKAAGRVPADDAPNVVLSTASPYKFPQAVLTALGEKLPADPFDMMDLLQSISGVPAPAALAGLKQKAVRFTDVVEKDGLYDYVLSTLHASRV